MTWGQRHWRAFWFAPEAALNLAAARVIFAMHALWILLSRDLPGLSGLPEEFWTHVPPSVHWRYLLWEGHPRLEYVLYVVAIAALCAAVLGLAPRVACFVAGLLLYHLAPLGTLIWSPMPLSRGFTITVLALLTLSFARYGDALRLRHRHRRKEQLPLSPAYNWPLRLVQLFLCQIYFSAGYTKLVGLGWAWISAANMRDTLLLLNQPAAFPPFTTIGLWLAQYPALCLGLAVGTLVWELSWLPAMFWKHARPWLAILGCIFHTGIFFAMNLAFPNVPQLLTLIDWYALTRRWTQQGG